MLDVELVLKAGAAAAFDGDTQHRAIALGLEDLPDAAGGPVADGDGSGHASSPVDGVIPKFIWYAVSGIVKYVISQNQMDKD
jgi:hypothetical protein